MNKYQDVIDQITRHLSLGDFADLIEAYADALEANEPMARSSIASARDTADAIRFLDDD